MSRIVISRAASRRWLLALLVAGFGLGGGAVAARADDTAPAGIDTYGAGVTTDTYGEGSILDTYGKGSILDTYGKGTELSTHGNGL